jgi:hypothetical protein
MAQQHQKQQTQASSHSGTHSSPPMESRNAAEAGAGAGAGDSVNTTTGKRKVRPSKQQDDAAEAKTLKKAARYAFIGKALEIG